MRKAVFILGALMASTPALAKKGGKGVAEKKAGVRVKVSQDLFGRQQDWSILDGEESDPVYTDTLTFLNGGGRLEATKLIGDGLEVGGMLGYTYIDQKTEEDGIAAGQGYNIGVTGAYNVKLGKSSKGFVQPMAGYTRSGMTPEGGDEDARKGIWFGGAVGARVRLFERVTFDPQLEFQQYNLTREVDGSDVEDLELRQRNMGLRWGITVML